MDSFLWAIEFKTTLNNFKYNDTGGEFLDGHYNK